MKKKLLWIPYYSWANRAPESDGMGEKSDTVNP